MSLPVKIGVLSFEHYHANFWTKAFLASEDADLVGFHEPDDKLAEDAVATHDIRRFTALDELLEAVDAVGICSATAGHLRLIEQAAEAGKAILCEKPIAPTDEGCRRIA
jgi:predicted dehydrogenase